jgi:hypothetical protein
MAGFAWEVLSMSHATRVARPGPRLWAIYSTHGKLLGRAPLGFLFTWPAASFAIGADGSIRHKPRKPAVPDDEYCFPLDLDSDGNADDGGKGGVA